MQKIKKINLVIALIVFVASALAAFILIKTGIAKKKLTGGLNTLDIIMIALAALVWACDFIDIYKLKNGKKKTGEIRFNVSISINKLFNISNIVILVISIFELIFFIIEGEVMNLIMATMLLSIALTNLTHSKSKDVIGENGIYYWGIYHSWDKFKSYEIDENTLKLNVEVRPLGIRSINPIKFFFDINEKDSISDFLNSKIDI